MSVDYHAELLQELRGRFDNLTCSLSLTMGPTSWGSGTFRRLCDKRRLFRASEPHFIAAYLKNIAGILKPGAMYFSLILTRRRLAHK